MNDDASKGTRPRGRKRRFAAGFLVGLAVAILAPLTAAALFVGGLFAYDEVVGLQRGERETVPFLTVDGRHVSAAGGRRVMAELDGHVFRQDCRDACDDIVSELGDAKSVRVLNADGRCVLCEDAGALAALRSRERWMVAGDQELQVVREPLL